MSFLDSLRRERSNPPAVWLQFIATYRAGVPDIYAFFEGRDDFSFYMPVLRGKWTRGAIVPFKCKGKAAVTGLIQRIQARIDEPWRALFFVDKDIDDIVGVPTYNCPFLYETECYSIENYLVVESLLCVIWTDLFQLSPVDSRFDLVLKQFRQALADYVGAMRLIMATIIHYRKCGSRPVLNEVDPGKLVQFNTEFRVARVPDWITYFKGVSGVPSDPDWRLVAEIDAELAKREYKTYLRGKFEIWFFVAFVNRVAAVVSERVGDQARAVIHTHLTTSNVVEVLAGRVNPSEHLQVFLKKCLPS
jgi:hypothetical protein